MGLVRLCWAGLHYIWLGWLGFRLYGLGCPATHGLTFTFALFLEPKVQIKFSRQQS